MTHGYFDPDFYGTIELLGRLRLENNRLAFNAEAAPGMQQIGKHGETSATLRGTGRLTYMMGIGRSIEAFASYANSGVSQLSQRAAAGYRYHAFGVSGSWTF